MIDNAINITRKTFLKNTNKEDRIQLEKDLGYNRDFTINRDWHVSYHKTKTINGKVVYFLQHSAIEYFFYS